MAGITSVSGRIIINSRGDRTIEVDVTSDGRFMGRAAAPSGASVGIHEAVGFPDGGPEASIRALRENSRRFTGMDPSDLRAVHDVLREMDGTPDYSGIGGSLAFALTVAAAESAAHANGIQMFEVMSERRSFNIPVPLGNILGGGAHAGPGTPDIQEILVCSNRAGSIHEAVGTNQAVHRELRSVISQKDPDFTNGRGDEGGWAPRMDNQAALKAAAEAVENLGFTLGDDVSLGVDFASSTQWDAERQAYIYDRAGFANDSGEQIEYASDIIRDYKLIYAEDAVHEEAFGDMAELAARFPDVMITGDDLTVTNRDILNRAIRLGSCNAAILKVNQAGSLYDAMRFADLANSNSIRLITSHRSGETADPHISHIGIATGSRMLKAGIVGGERVAKLNELLRLSEHGLICGMAEL